MGMVEVSRTKEVHHPVEMYSNGSRVISPTDVIRFGSPVLSIVPYESWIL